MRASLAARQTSAAGIAPARGFTLIEILVVVVILAVLAAAVSIALSGAGGERQLEREAERLQALIGYACEHAEIGGIPVGLSLVDGGYAFSRRDGETWKPFEQGELRDRRWPGNVRVELSRDGKRIEIPPQPPEIPPVVCFASGELTPFRLELGLPDLALRWRLDGRLDGDVQRERRDAH
ncbi:MAG TPA: type II secretion system minor pseudopilin GspH [Tahibacter sp.]|uniref:type II secretion system minor pseudopilin GspH n=1 Tax=Tahibacter sp. TaxID=2056211 RepID=UPI002CC79C99|nr:type II secretion system minor pseudopilin GspH [Tahibacter sp.]HSX60285.1 type II secretion system minor pseudopilin GspH [Tahibacter sp.]